MKTYTLTISDDQLNILKEAVFDKITKETKGFFSSPPISLVRIKRKKLVNDISIILGLLNTIEKNPNKPLIPNTDEQ